MFIDSNEKCPVCNKVFTEEDDIVICPDCGTPHHRACYHSLGHCFNADKHKMGFEYESAADAANEAVSGTPENNGQYYDSQQEQYYQQLERESNQTVFCQKCGAEIKNDAPFCSYCGERQSYPHYRGYNEVNNFPMNVAEQQKYENENRTIDGKKIADVAAVVRTNTSRFISKFIKNKKFSWNWCAFIFGSYYLFFRKMYKQGIIFMAFELIVSLVSGGLFSNEISQFYTQYNEFVSANYQELLNGGNSELINQLYSIIQPVLPVVLIVLGANLIIHLIAALFSDKFYRAKAIDVLNRVDRNLAGGGSLNITSLPASNGSTFSQSDLRRIYLERLGGTSILPPIMAYLVLDLITYIISII